MSWRIRFRVHQWLRGSLWFLPALGAVVGVLLSDASIRLDPYVTLPHGWQYSASTAGTLLSTVVGAMIGLIGFVVTISVLVVQMATGTFSARYMRLWYRDLVLKSALAWLVGTLTFSYSLLRRSGEQSVPNLGVSLVGFFVVVGVVFFLVFLDRFVHRLRPVAVASIVAAAGRSTMETSSVRVTESELALVSADPALVASAGRAGAIQAFDRRGLVRFAERHDVVLVLPHAVGDFVSRGARLVEVHGGEVPDSARRELLGMVALGVERTIEQDVAFALRILVDIANKALSAAVNDPTTAIQMLNQLGDSVEQLARIPNLDGARAFDDGSGRTRVLLSAHRFEDFLSLAVTEIREYGASSIQVMRRLRALLDDLRESALDEYVPYVDAELRRLDATVAASFGEKVDLDLAATPDRQGIGGPPTLARAAR